ncbi:GNAT family N-acetyltransferase [Chroococcidiopsidales cyanobacterium LEGE 13417]|nr:GNAT family N-acetyltransferase [Chroococcidiopsidales cyanobacterium LEGE 13417]
MKQPLRIDITEKPHPEDIEFILQQLLAFNRDRAGEGHFQQLAIFLRNEGDRLAGGLIGSTYWQWLYIDILWIDETWRGQGYGHALLEAASKKKFICRVGNAHLTKKTNLQAAGSRHTAKQ